MSWVGSFCFVLEKNTEREKQNWLTNLLELVKVTIGMVLVGLGRIEFHNLCIVVVYVFTNI